MKPNFIRDVRRDSYNSSNVFIFIFAFFCLVMAAIKITDLYKEMIFLSRITRADAAGAGEGSDILLSGIVGVETGSGVLGDDARKLNLVIYAKEKWTIKKDSEGHRYGSWQKFTPVLPAQLTIDHNVIKVTAVHGLSLENPKFTSGVLYEGTGDLIDEITSGSLRLTGFRIGDYVNLFGKPGTRSFIAVERVIGGKIIEYIAAVKKKILFMMIISGMSLFAAVMFAWVGIRNWKKSSPEL